MLTLVRSLAGDEKKHLTVPRLSRAHLDTFRRSKFCPLIRCFRRRITRCEVQPAQMISRACLLVRDSEARRSLKKNEKKKKKRRNLKQKSQKVKEDGFHTTAPGRRSASLISQTCQSVGT